MAIGYLDDSKLTAIANSIRSKTGSSSTMSVDDMPTEISNIPTGGGIPTKDVNFYDYDGTLLYSYTLEEAQELQALPELPTAPYDYTADSWTESLAFVNALTYPYNIGVNYTTTREGTELDILVPEEEKDIYYCLQPNCTINFGDGTSDSNPTNNWYYERHTYSTSGKKTITYNTTSSSLSFVGEILTPGTLAPVSDTDRTMPFIALWSDAFKRFGTTSYGTPDYKLITTIRKGTKKWDSVSINASLKSSSLKTVIIPAVASQISFYRLFQSCDALQFISIPSTYTTIVDYAFDGCTSLKGAVLPSSMINFGEAYYTFQNCESLDKVTLPPTITSLGSGVFQYCSSLKKIIIPDTVGTLRSTIFSGCFSLEEITIPDTVTSIQSNAFEACYNLKKVTLPSGLTALSSYLFRGCDALETVNIPSTVTTIYSYCFSGCTNLKKVTLPSGLTFIDNYAFRNCPNLEEITIPDTVTSIGTNIFENCSNLKKLTLSSSLTSIPYQAFTNCYSLEEVTIPEGVTSTGQNAFRATTSLQKVTIPSTITSIGANSFQGNMWESKKSNLNTVIILATTPPTLGSSAFANNATSRRIYVPYSADHSIKAAYQTAWSTYSSDIYELPQS